MWRVVALLAIALLVGGIGPAHARAQGDGVYFDDPDSPGGKEYSIPHERFRRESGGPGGTGSPGSGGETPRFGVGIEPRDGGSSGGNQDSTGGVAGDSASGGEESGGSGGGGDGFGGSGPDGAPAGEGSAGGSDSGSGEAPYNATSTASDSDLDLTVSAIALGVLIAGAGLGLLLRRLRRDPSS